MSDVLSAVRLRLWLELWVRVCGPRLFARFARDATSVVQMFFMHMKVPSQCMNIKLTIYYYYFWMQVIWFKIANSNGSDLEKIISLINFIF